MMLSLRDLAVKYKELPTSLQHVNWSEYDEWTNIGAGKLQATILEELDEIVNLDIEETERVTAVEVEQYIIDTTNQLLKNCWTGKERLEYGSFYNRGLVWSTEALYWRERAYADSLNAAPFIAKMKESLDLGCRYLMASEILIGYKDERTVEILLNNMRSLGIDEEVEAIADSMVRIRPSEHGRANFKLN